LFSKIGIDLLKAGLSAAIASAVVGIMISGLVAFGVIAGATVLGVVVGVLVVAVVVGFALDYADKKIAASLGEEDMTAYLSKKSQAITQYLGEKFSKESLYKDYYQLFEPVTSQTGVIK
jgi:hypothetical protein